MTLWRKAAGVNFWGIFYSPEIIWYNFSMAKTILVDMDDTIECLVQAWVEYVNEKYGTDTKSEDVLEWDISVAFPTLSREQVYDVLLEDELYKRIRPMDDAALYLKKLQDEGNEIYIVTNSVYQTIRPKMDEVLFRYFPFIGWDNVILAKNKKMIKGDFLVDDGIHNLLEGDYKKILFTAPHNRSFDAGANGMVRADSWEEAYSTFAC